MDIKTQTVLWYKAYVIFNYVLKGVVIFVRLLPFHKMYDVSKCSTSLFVRYFRAVAIQPIIFQIFRIFHDLNMIDK